MSYWNEEIIDKVKMFKYIRNNTETFFKGIEESTKNLEYRDGQYQMAIDIVESIEQSQHLIIEAGVGIGKSYAYLVPLLYYYKYSNKPFVISTSTIALQEQVENDIKKLARILNIKVDIVVAKGKTQYICQKRLGKEAVKDNELLMLKDEITKNHDKGDRKYYERVSEKLWNLICVDESCEFSRCKNSFLCLFLNVRSKMKMCNGVIICNHDLLIEDLRREDDRKLLSSAEYMVIDEAHNLEEKFRNAFKSEISYYKLKKLINDADSALMKTRGYSNNLKSILSNIDKLFCLVKIMVKNEISLINEKNNQNGISSDDYDRLTFRFNSDIIEISARLHGSIIDVASSLEINDDNDKYEDLISKLKVSADNFSEMKMGYKSNNIFWIEIKNGKHIITSAPKATSDYAFKYLFTGNYSRKQNIKFLTSATLTTKGDEYIYFNKTIGIEKDYRHIFVADVKKSPYNYDENSLLYCPKDITSPKYRNKYIHDLSNRIEELLKITNGKTLILFTSKNDMKEVFKIISNKNWEFELLCQSDGSSQNLIKEHFKKEINSVLFSTGAFWEGIDIKGESLSSVIIARLPFPVVDPIIEYKASKYFNTDDKLKCVYVPEMLIKLKQGVGRLIRGFEDKGIVSILDSRLKSTNCIYYKDVINSLPIKNMTEDIKDVEKFAQDKKINTK